MEWLKDRAGKITLGVIAAIVLLTVGAIWNARAAEAADKGGQSLLPIGEMASINAKSWSGCGIGVGGSYLDGEVSGFMGPANIGVDGQMLDVRFLCDYQAGSFVIGGNVDYGMVFGDLQTIGGNAAWAVGGRVGPLINPNTLLFVSGGWTRADTDAGNLDGWYGGVGIETKLPNSPIFLTLEYQHRVFDLTDIGAPPGFDGTVDVIRAGVAIKLNFGK